MKEFFESASRYVRWFVAGLIAAIAILPTVAAINASV